MLNNINEFGQNNYYNKNQSSYNAGNVLENTLGMLGQGPEVFSPYGNPFSSDPQQNPMMNPFEALKLFSNTFMGRMFETKMFQMFSKLMGPLAGLLAPYLPQVISSKPVAANEEGKIWGDPHFVGADGKKYDFQGEAGKTYNLFSDTGLQMNGKFDHWGGDKNIVGETGLTVQGFNGSTSVKFDKQGTATINGMKLKDGASVTLADGGTATLKGNQLTVTTAAGYTITETAINGQYLNIDVKSGEYGVAQDGRLPGGLLGQSFHPDWEAPTKEEENPEAYAQEFEVSQLTPQTTRPIVIG